MTRAKVYELTKKKPSFKWAKVTIKQVIYEALTELKRADVPKIVDWVLLKVEFPGTHASLEQQIRSNLCQFTKEGVTKKLNDRRYRPRVTGAKRKLG